jgi:hypothetical protein
MEKRTKGASSFQPAAAGSAVPFGALACKPKIVKAFEIDPPEIGKRANFEPVNIDTGEEADGSDRR